MNELQVTAAGAYEHVLNEVIPVFSRDTGVQVRMAIANAAGVIKRVESGEVVDVVLTSAAGITHLTSTGLADAATATKIGSVGLGIAVTAGIALPDLSSGAAVRAALLSAARVAFIDPKGGGTSGPFIAKVFETLGIAREMGETGILSKTGRDVVRAMASGEASMGISQATEFIGAKGVQFAGYLPADVQVVSVYSGAVAIAAAAPDAARRFLAFLTSPAGAEYFRRAGWS